MAKKKSTSDEPNWAYFFVSVLLAYSAYKLGKVLVLQDIEDQFLPPQGGGRGFEDYENKEKEASAPKKSKPPVAGRGGGSTIDFGNVMIWKTGKSSQTVRLPSNLGS